MKFVALTAQVPCHFLSDWGHLSPHLQHFEETVKVEETVKELWLGLSDGCATTKGQSSFPGTWQ